MNYWRYKLEIGVIGISEENGAITNLWFGSELPFVVLNPDKNKSGLHEKESPLLVEAARQVSLYLRGALLKFTLPLSPQGTPLMQNVWKTLCEIPYGKTASYSDIACAIKKDTAVRFVGNANNKNPIAIIIPCHRVIGKNGKLTGYAGGLELKQRLLDIESGALAVAAIKTADATIPE